MSRLRPVRAACPSCGHEDVHAIFASLNGARLPAAARDVLDGRFQVVDCPACRAEFQIPALCLYVDLGHRLWVVHHPTEDLTRWRDCEAQAERLFDDEVRGHPDPKVPELYDGVRPRVVFGHLALAEAIRVATHGLDPAVLECVKATILRDAMGELYPHGPAELVAEGFDDGLRFAVLPIGAAEPVDTLEVPAGRLGDVLSRRPEFEAVWPELFSRPFVSTLRYLLP